MAPSTFHSSLFSLTKHAIKAVFISTTEPASSVAFLYRDRLVVTHSGVFAIAKPVALETQIFLDPADKSLEFTKKGSKPVAMFHAMQLFLMCYDSAFRIFPYS
jgi:hypothetical protein